MGSKSVEDMIEASSGVHFSGFHMNGLESRHIEKPTTSLSTDNVHKQPFVIGKFSEHGKCMLLSYYCNND